MIIPRRCFLLLVGDDGALLLPPGTMREVGPIAVADHSEPSAARAMQVLRQSPETPIVLLADTNAQTLRLETLPPLPRLDRRKLLQRRLDQAFARHRFKTTVSLSAGRALLLAIEDEGPLHLWLTRLGELPNPSGGLVSLPLEASAMLTALRSDAARGWAMLLLWQRTGGFRQIVTLDGKLVFSRMAAQLPDQTSAQSALGFLAVDLQATQGYLARFGLSGETRLRLTAVLPPELAPAFRDIFAEHETLVLSPYEAAQKLGAQPTFGPKEAFCDALTAGWIAHKTHFQRLMMSKQDHETHLHRLIRKSGTALATALLLAALAMTGHMMWQAGAAWLKTRQLEREIVLLEKEWHDTQRQLAPATEPLGRLRLAVQRRRLFTAPPVDDLDQLFATLAQAAGSQTRAQQISYTPGRLTLDIKSQNTNIGREEIGAELNALQQRFQAALEGYNVAITRYPFPHLADETLSNTPAQAEPLPARFLIERQAEP